MVEIFVNEVKFPESNYEELIEQLKAHFQSESGALYYLHEEDKCFVENQEDLDNAREVEVNKFEYDGHEDRPN